MTSIQIKINRAWLWALLAAVYLLGQPFDWIGNAHAQTVQQQTQDDDWVPITRSPLQCVCKKITLKGDDPADNKAAGPDGDGTKGWPADAVGRWDGKTLGPFHGSPTNPAGADGEKKYTGFAFEITAEIEGNPDDCKQIQVVKASDVFPSAENDCRRAGGTWAAGKCTLPKIWFGTEYDIDLSGNKKDVSTPQKCAAAGGKWFENLPDGTPFKKCGLRFPESGTAFGPDTDIDTSAGGAYEKVHDYKVHLKTSDPKKIIWFDPAGGTNVNGWKRAADFMAMIKGTDGKYCYLKFRIETEKKAGKDDEKLIRMGQKNSSDTPPQW